MTVYKIDVYVCSELPINVHALFVTAGRSISNVSNTKSTDNKIPTRLHVIDCFTVKPYLWKGRITIQISLSIASRRVAVLDPNMDNSTNNPIARQCEDCFHRREMYCTFAEVIKLTIKIAIRYTANRLSESIRLPNSMRICNFPLCTCHINAPTFRELIATEYIKLRVMHAFVRMLLQSANAS